MTFSSKIRQELAQRHRQHAREADWALASFASFAASLGKIREEKAGWELTLRVANGPTVSLLETVIPTLGFSIRKRLAGKRDLILVIFIPLSGRPALFFDFDAWLEETGDLGLEPLLASFFLATGVMSDPVTGRYRLAFSPSAGGAIPLMLRVFDKAGFQAGQTRHQGRIHLLFTKGEDVARFLLLSGAHNALLLFEQERSERELIGQVNRQVNFDEANANRRADSIARQLEAIQIIEEIRGIDFLPPALAEAAYARLDNRGASLEELGEAMEPPVSKSGMSHRFSRIRVIARTLKGDE